MIPQPAWVHNSWTKIHEKCWSTGRILPKPSFTSCFLFHLPNRAWKNPSLLSIPTIWIHFAMSPSWNAWEFFKGQNMKKLGACDVEEQIAKFLANIQFGQWFVNENAWCYSRHIASRFFHTDFLHTKNLNHYQLHRYWAVLLIIGDRIHIVDINTGRVGCWCDSQTASRFRNKTTATLRLCHFI